MQIYDWVSRGVLFVLGILFYFRPAWLLSEDEKERRVTNETAAAPAGANIEEAKFEEVAPAAITAQSAVPAETMPPIPTPTPVPREEATEEAAPAAIEDDPFNV